MNVSFSPCTIKTGHLTYSIFSALSYTYFAKIVPSFPTNYFTRFLTDAKGLIKTRDRGFGALVSFFFRSSSRATPAPIDLPTTIIFRY